MNELDEKNDNLCPFCYKKKPGHDKPKKVSARVKSEASKLKEENDTWGNKDADLRRKEGDLPYTLAKHHLISAIQCYAQIRPLVRMGNLVGYDINNQDNGIGLPTTHWGLKYPAGDGNEKKKYGELDDPKGKQDVAFTLMRELRAQWHVGHHAFEMNIDSWKESGAEEENEDDYGHETAYDSEIISRLFDMVKSFPKNLCEEPKHDDNFKEEMKKLSDLIKEHLMKFSGE